VPGEWLSNFCFMGRSLRAGHVPLWNPHVLGGTPFAADPIHGWMSLPAMLTMTAFPCGTGFKAFLLLQPILAGLGLWWFLRSEGLSRAASAMGGMVLAFAIAGAQDFALPWTSGYLAWTAVMLATASRLTRAARWPARLGWLAATAIAWGQVAAAHFSNGLIVGSLALLLYLGARLIEEVRAGRRSVREGGLIGVLLAASLFLVNMAVLLPRMANYGDFEVSMGYDRVDQLSRALTGHPGGAIQPPFLAARWPLSLSLSPGLHLAA